MKIPYRMLIVPLLLASSSTLCADESVDQKLDAILKEITRLNERVRQLEIQVGKLTAENRAAERQQPPTLTADPVSPDAAIQLKILKQTHNPESTIRLQQESPGELLKNIHERERALRKRPFPADVIPN